MRKLRVPAFAGMTARRRHQRARRHAVLPRQVHRVGLQQAIVRQALDGREVAVRDVLGPLEAADVVGDRAQAQVHAHAVPRRQVARGRMDQAAVEQDHRTGRAFRRDDAAVLPAGTFDELRHQVLVDHPERIARRAQVVARVDHAALVAAGDEHERPVELVHVVEEDRDVHRPLGRHHVVVHPGPVVLVPLPHVALEGHLAVDLVLVHVDVFAEEIHHRPDHARVARQARERLAVQVRREIRADRVAALLAHVEGLAPCVQCGHRVGQRARFVGCEQPGKEEVAVAIELRQLLGGELHCLSPRVLRTSSSW
jgi:hypothetical protein